MIEASLRLIGSEACFPCLPEFNIDSALIRGMRGIKRKKREVIHTANVDETPIRQARVERMAQFVADNVPRDKFGDYDYNAMEAFLADLASLNDSRGLTLICD